MSNIVICADGTWNRPEEDLEKDFPTNVLKLARAIKPSGPNLKQHVFYDWGLGSYHDKVTAGATGRGIHKNILDCYRYIVQNYTTGDSLYLFGFSRGAYTVRALCGLINNCGILKRPVARLISEAWKIYKNPQAKFHPDGDGAKEFRASHSHASRKVHFVGVWDTAGALGIPFSVMGLFDSHDEFYDTKMGANVSYARHALSIDEQREDFEPTVWTPRTGVDLKQVWFAGVHSDIGRLVSTGQAYGQLRGRHSARMDAGRGKDCRSADRAAYLDVVERRPSQQTASLSQSCLSLQAPASPSIAGGRQTHAAASECQAALSVRFLVSPTAIEDTGGTLRLGWH